MKKKYPINWNDVIKIAAIGITIFFVAILFTKISISDIISTLTQINPLYLVLSFFFYIMMYISRTGRFYYLNHKEIPYKDLFPIVCFYNLINNILPSITGELSYVYLIRKFHKRTVGEGIAALFIARMFDFIGISVIFLISFIVIINSIAANQNLIYWIILILGLFIAILGIFLFKSKNFFYKSSKILVYLNIHTTKPGDFILKKGEETILALERSNTSGNYSYLMIFLYSLSICFFLYSYTAVLVFAMGISLPLLAILFACSFAFFTNTFPIQGIGNFGTFEAGWTLGFLSVGVPAELAISSGFGYHIIALAFNFILAIFGFITINRNRLSTLFFKSKE